MKVVLAFDSFKGNLPTQEVCGIAAEGIRSGLPGAETVILPMADGGEGTAEAMMAVIRSFPLGSKSTMPMVRPKNSLPTYRGWLRKVRSLVPIC